ncbi:MAG TPA: glycosyltransferase family 1 protein [Terriglobia bacterium]|nr:glycosyltransferase family 1 protein [Terriglobia bacterium]
MGGAVTYITNFLRNLPPPESGHQFLVILAAQTAATQPELPPNVKLLPTSISYANGLKRLWWDQITLRRTLKEQQADVLFSTANFAMFRCPVPQVLLVRNALYFSPLYQQTLLPRDTLRMRIAYHLRRWLICRSAQRADRVMAPTQSMLDGLFRYVTLPRGKAFVNSHGVAYSFTSNGHRPSAVATTERHLTLLYVSLYSEHKNLRTALRALPLLNSNHGSRRFELVTTADPAWKGASWTVTWKSDLELSRSPEIQPWVKFIGPLDRAQTERLYDEADILLFPSLVESFGMPMVEAMARGVPIVAADTPVNHEICAGAALYFSPLDPEDLARQVRRLASDGPLRQELGAVGVERARARFQWGDHVKRLVEACASLAGAKA